MVFMGKGLRKMYGGVVLRQGGPTVAFGEVCCLPIGRSYPIRPVDLPMPQAGSAYPIAILRFETAATS